MSCQGCMYLIEEIELIDVVAHGFTTAVPGRRSYECNRPDGQVCTGGFISSPNQPTREEWSKAQEVEYDYSPINLFTDIFPITELPKRRKYKFWGSPNE